MLSTIWDFLKEYPLSSVILMSSAVVVLYGKIRDLLFSCNSRDRS